ncbi:calcium-binding protein [Teichococcus aestuarii]|uniref:Calcium-binding protein n=1 Tax=Teichococcus aestuarii TaxID=568898 RepID=A0A2U1V6C4_9PROT|nr:hypothetical protein [Pseudoroseomonas aestuarii]PWC29460.1 hypothetical protein CR165_05775 [Pseudoroseomonas aestuarii]
MSFGRFFTSDWMHYTRPALDWFNSKLVYGTRGDDTIGRDGNGLLVFGLAGDDQITVDGRANPDGAGNKVLGGSGRDSIIASGNKNLLLGETGNDSITATGNDNTAFGGAGDDVIAMTGQNASGNAAHGGSGNDTLSAFGYDNRLYGGAGEDVLSSRSFSVGQGIQVGDGTVMSGGSGADRFVLNNTSALSVLDNGDDVVSAGDTFRGVIDVITDYRAGEVIETGATTRVSGPVALDELQTIPPGNLGAVLAAGEYALFHGALTEAGVFSVAAAGPDLLMIYETANSADPTASGAVVLRDYASDSVLIA